MGDRHTHHHGLLAGLGAGTAAVLGCFLLILGVWHRVSPQVGVAVTVLIWAFVAVLLVAALYAVTFLFLRARHHVTHPETLTRQSVRAEVLPASLHAADDSPAVPAPAPLPALPASVVHNWNLHDPDTAAAVVRAIAEGRQGDELH